MKPGSCDQLEVSASCDQLGKFPNRSLLAMTEVERADVYKTIGFLKYMRRWREEQRALVRKENP